MSASARTVSHEPYNGKTLGDYLHREHGAVPLQDRQRGSHFRWAFPDGSTVPMVAPNQPVTNLIARLIARKLGMAYPDLRKAMGVPTVNRKRGQYKPPPAPASRVGKSTVLRVIAEMREELDHLEGELRGGDRDPAVYQRAFTALVGALDEVTNYRRTNDLIARQGDG